MAREIVGKSLGPEVDCSLRFITAWYALVFVEVQFPDWIVGAGVLIFQSRQIYVAAPGAVVPVLRPRRKARS